MTRIPRRSSSELIHLIQHLMRCTIGRYSSESELSTAANLICAAEYKEDSANGYQEVRTLLIPMAEL